jgi:nucleoside-diphosphate-sugar epimerase
MVTGASGFLGSEIVRLAHKTGWQVRAFDRDQRIQPDGVEIAKGDIADREALGRACEGVSVIIHAAGIAHVFGSAAKDATYFNIVNETGTANVLDVAVEAAVQHTVLVSSVAVYGSCTGTHCDETAACHPKGPYANSKWQGELRAIERAAKGKMSLTILRFATLYGEGDRGNVAKLINALDCGRFIWPGPGQNRKSLIYREDAVRACLRVLEHPVSGVAVFNVTARPVTMREVVSAICQALSRPVPRLRIPLAFIAAVRTISHCIGDPGQFGQRLEKFMDDDVYDGSKFETMFEFCPEVSLAEGIRREVHFLRMSKP